MGGTTAKICLIEGFAPRTARTFEVARTQRFSKGSGMPISIPVIEMIEIGAGGGSLAGVDAMGRIQTGPESAGSEPGPACYGRGGKRPAITDPDLLLGKLDPDNFAGGAIKLDVCVPQLDRAGKRKFRRLRPAPTLRSRAGWTASCAIVGGLRGRGHTP
jgi:N-methylhydantoinase A